MQQHTVRNRVRTGLAVISTAAVLVAGVGAVSQAANGDPFKLGSKNKATKSTSLTKKGAGPALKLKVKKGPALSVNTPDLIANLNADSVDSKGLDELEPTTYTTSLGVAGQAGTAAPLASQTTTLPAGSYEFNIMGFVDQDTGDFNQCAVLDATRFIASGGTDYSSVFLLAEANDDVNQNLAGHGIGTVTAGNRLVFVCFLDTSTTIYTPVRFTVKRVDRVADVPGIGGTTFPKPGGARGLSN